MVILYLCCYATAHRWRSCQNIIARLRMISLCLFCSYKSYTGGSVIPHRDISQVLHTITVFLKIHYWVLKLLLTFQLYINLIVFKTNISFFNFKIFINSFFNVTFGLSYVINWNFYSVSTEIERCYACNVFRCTEFGNMRLGLKVLFSARCIRHICRQWKLIRRILARSSMFSAFDFYVKIE